MRSVSDWSKTLIAVLHYVYKSKYYSYLHQLEHHDIFLRTMLKQVAVAPLLLNNQNLEQVKQYKYLGVTISSNLRWSPHIEQICKSARKKLEIINRNFSHTSSSPHVILQLYLSFVRPSLEYASQVWDPHSSKDVKVLENIQKFALRIATKQYYARYEILLDTFQLPSLENRRSFLS